MKINTISNENITQHNDSNVLKHEQKMEINMLSNETINIDLEKLKQENEQATTKSTTKIKESGSEVLASLLPDYNEFEDIQTSNTTNMEYYADYVREDSASCAIPITYSDNATPVDIQMLTVISTLQFPRHKEYDDIKIDKDEFNEDSKLKVFVVPHSRNVAGWLKTFDEYFEEDTESILMNMILFLNDNPEMKFIWTEISFFSKFFEKLKPELQKIVKKLVKWHKLEFVTGGWVIPDEANTHWYSILIQLTEGQKWLFDNLNITPVSSWAVDAYGHSSTIPYLLKKCGVQNLVIQRTQHGVKNYLADELSLEFYWRQIWDESGDTDLFTHMMPYKDYSTSHACGPEFEVCKQFDFMVSDKLLRKFAVDIEETNIEEKSKLLADQWVQKSALFKTKSLLMPLGDYLSYKEMAELESKYENYQKLFHFIDSKHNFYTNAQFATLQDYFNSARNEYMETDFPILTGDFFTYSDEQNVYWSGYYTTRPFQKVLERTLLHYVKSAEMLMIWNDWSLESKLHEKLQYARRQLALFQNHEAITGTAKTYVANDYENKMLKGIEKCKFVIQQAAYRLLTEPNDYHPNFEHEFLTINLESSWQNNFLTIPLKKNTILVFQNSLPQWREEYVNVYIPQQFVVVSDSQSNKINAQVSLIWNWNKGWLSFFNIPKTDPSKYKLTFKIKVPPLGLTTYSIEMIKNDIENSYTTFSNTTVFTHMPLAFTELVHKVDVKLPMKFSFKTKFGIEASFNAEGMLQSLSINNSIVLKTELEFIKYGNEMKDNPSGAYIFSPSEVEKKVEVVAPTVVVVIGEIESTVAVGLPNLIHTIIFRADFGIEIRNFIDISDKRDIEIAMRIKTNILNGNIFYTDVNGFQIIKRNFLHQIPLQGNFYPIPSCIYIEDRKYRFTILTAQPSGGTSKYNGEIEIMLDRRLSTDDKKGLNQDVSDNKPIQLKFRLVIEPQSYCLEFNPDYPGGFVSPNVHNQHQHLLFPINELYWKKENWKGLIHKFGESHAALEDDMEIVALRNLGHNNEFGMIIHRTNLEKCTNKKRNLKLNIKELFGLRTQPNIYSTQITLLEKIKKIAAYNVIICPMDIKAYIIEK